MPHGALLAGATGVTRGAATLLDDAGSHRVSRRLGHGNVQRELPARAPREMTNPRCTFRTYLSTDSLSLSVMVALIKIASTSESTVSKSDLVAGVPTPPFSTCQPFSNIGTRNTYVRDGERHKRAGRSHHFLRQSERYFVFRADPLNDIGILPVQGEPVADQNDVGIVQDLAFSHETLGH